MLNFFKVTITDTSGEKHVLDRNGFDCEQVMKDLAYTAKEQGFIITNTDNKKNKMSAVLHHAIVNVHIEPCPRKYIQIEEV